MAIWDDISFKTISKTIVIIKLNAYISISKYEQHEFCTFEWIVHNTEPHFVFVLNYVLQVINKNT